MSDLSEFRRLSREIDLTHSKLKARTASISLTPPSDKIHLDMREVRAFARALKTYEPALRKEMDKMSRKSAQQEIVPEVRKRAPVRTGAMRRSVRILGGALGNRLVVGNKKVYYTWFVEAGTKRGIKPTHFIKHGISAGYWNYRTLWASLIDGFIRKHDKQVAAKVAAAGKGS